MKLNEKIIIKLKYGNENYGFHDFTIKEHTLSEAKKMVNDLKVEHDKITDKLKTIKGLNTSNIDGNITDLLAYTDKEDMLKGGEYLGLTGDELAIYTEVWEMLPDSINNINTIEYDFYLSLICDESGESFGYTLSGLSDKISQDRIGLIVNTISDFVKKK